MWQFQKMDSRDPQNLGIEKRVLQKRGIQSSQPEYV
jgi:hypothetical protein